MERPKKEDYNLKCLTDYERFTIDQDKFIEFLENKSKVVFTISNNKLKSVLKNTINGKHWKV